MLPKEFRMKSKKDFTYVYRRGKRIGGEYGVMNFLLDSAVEKNDTIALLFGFVTSKKIGKAVKRNRVRRILSAIAHSEGLPFLQNSFQGEEYKGKRIFILFNVLKYCNDYKVLARQYMWQLRKGVDMVKSSSNRGNRGVMLN